MTQVGGFDLQSNNHNQYKISAIHNYIMYIMQSSASSNNKQRK